MGRNTGEQEEELKGEDQKTQQKYPGKKKGEGLPGFFSTLGARIKRFWNNNPIIKKIRNSLFGKVVGFIFGKIVNFFKGIFNFFKNIFISKKKEVKKDTKSSTSRSTNKNPNKQDQDIELKPIQPHYPPESTNTNQESNTKKQRSSSAPPIYDTVSEFAQKLREEQRQVGQPPVIPSFKRKTDDSTNIKWGTEFIKGKMTCPSTSDLTEMNAANALKSVNINNINLSGTNLYHLETYLKVAETMKINDEKITIKLDDKTLGIMKSKLEKDKDALHMFPNLLKTVNAAAQILEEEPTTLTSDSTQKNKMQ